MKILIVLALIGICLAAETSDKSTVSSTANPVTSSTTTSTTTTTTITPPTPAPLPKPDELLFNITTKDGNVCALFSFLGTIEVKTIVNGTEQPEGEKIYLLNSTTQVNDQSFCDENLTVLVLKINNLTDETLKLQLNHTKPSYLLDMVKVDLGKNGTFSNSDSLIKVDDGKSYLCKTNPDIRLVNVANNQTNVYLTLKDLKIDAFRTSKDATFRQAIQCETDFPSNDFVPLAVGCALISLVFIVLIAYIVGRKRSRRLTYQSV